MESIGWARNRVFTPLEDVEDEEIFEFIDKVSASVGNNSKELWGIIGEDNLKVFAQDYPIFFKRASLYKFLKRLE